MGDEERLPWMKFDVGLWLSDMHVRAMEPAVRGIYIDLLAFDWQEDGIPDDPDYLARALGVDADALRDAYRELSERFGPHPSKDGHVTHPRICKARQEIREEKKKRSEAARKAARARWDDANPNGGDASGNADASKSQSDRTVRASDSISNSTSSSTQKGEEHEKGEGPRYWMHDIWHEELGLGRRIKLTPTRGKKYDLMWEEHLEATRDPKRAWKLILQRVKASDHHMSERAYQMPESLLRNAERRDQWVERTLDAARKGGATKRDRKRRRLSKVLDAMEAGRD